MKAKELLLAFAAGVDRGDIPWQPGPRCCLITGLPYEEDYLVVHEALDRIGRAIYGPTFDPKGAQSIAIWNDQQIDKRVISALLRRAAEA